MKQGDGRGDSNSFLALATVGTGIKSKRTFPEAAMIRINVTAETRYSNCHLPHSTSNSRASVGMSDVMLRALLLQ